MENGARKRICIYSQNAFPLIANNYRYGVYGGAEVQLSALGEKIAERGYDVYFLIGEFKQEKYLKIKNNLYAYKTPLRYLGGSNLFIIPDWIKLILTLKKIRADYHIIKLPNHLLFPIGVFCKLFCKKLIFICQIDRDTDMICFRQSANFIEYVLYRIGLLLTDQVITQNSIQLENIKKFYKGKATKIENIANLSLNQAGEKKSHILWVGSNLKRKRPEIFLEIAKKCPQYFFKMIMSEPDKKAGDLGIRKKCREIDNIEFLGPTAFLEVEKYFRTAALFISTSELEGFPNVFLHSWQCGTPVISLGIDPDGVIEKHELGIVTRTIDNLVEATQKVMSDPVLRKRLRENAYKYVLKYHNSEKIIDKYCQLIEAL